MSEIEKLEQWYQQRAQGPELAARVVVLEAQRDALLGVLKAAVRQTQELYAGAAMEPSWLAWAEAAIAKAEVQP